MTNRGRVADAGFLEAGPEFFQAGFLEGRTVVRFAHAFETGGGVERYLDDLDRTLLAHNAMTVIRIFIGSDSNQMAERTQNIGRGSLVSVPLPLRSGESLQIAPDVEPSGIHWKHRFRDWVLYNPIIWRLYTNRYLTNWRLPRRSGQVVGAGRKVADLMRRYSVDLIVLHFFGGSDADEIVAEALRAEVPYAVLNHYSNDRFLHLSMRKHAMLASGVAGVNALDLPGYLRGGFCNLSDGVDLEFFRPIHATSPADAPAEPLILLPARVVRPKGHLDLVRAAAKLRKEGLKFTIGFAGRVESSDFVEELRSQISRFGMENHVRFLGELSVKELRNWYGASALVAFPSYHHEGLPRVILEAQAMEVPVVAYGTGGVAEGILSGQTGYLLKTGDIAGLASRLAELLNASGIRKRMGVAGRHFVESTFNLDALAHRHEAFYFKHFICR